MLDALSKIAKAIFLPWPPLKPTPAILERLFVAYIVPALFAVIVVGNWPQWGNYAIATGIALGLWLNLKTIKW